MAAGRLLIPGWMPALDEDGNPIPNARVFFYLNKTTTLAEVFSDETMTVPLANPVPSNASGRFPAVWADDSVLYSASVDAPYGPAGIPFTYDDLSVSMAADILVAGAAEAAADEAQQTLVEIQNIIDAAMQAGGGEAAVAGAIAGATAGEAAAQAVVSMKLDKLSSLAELDGLSSLAGQVSVQYRTSPGDGYAGTFEWIAGDQSTNVAGDPMSGVWVAPDGQDGSGGAWKRVFTGTVAVTWFGAKGDGLTDDSAAFQAACNFVSRNRLGELFVPCGKYVVKGVTYGPFCVFNAENGVEYILPNASNTFMFKALGFDQWADSVPARPDQTPISISRSFAWHSSPAARNSVAATQGYVVGSIVVTHPTNPMPLGWFVGEKWWLATSVSGSGYADSDANWIEVPSLLGALKSGFSGGYFNGNRVNQSGDADLVCHYGTAPIMRDFRVSHAAGWGMFVEAAGGTYSPQVGVSQQGVWDNVRINGCGTVTKGNLYYNGQSDTDFNAIQCYANPASGYELYLGAKASGSRFSGGHVYALGGDIPDPSASNTSWGIKSDAQACDWDMHVETSVWLNGARHKGFFKVYRASAASEVDSAALWLNNPSMCDIHVRTYLMLSCFRVMGTDGGNNILSGQLDHRVGKAGTSVVSTLGSAIADSTTVFARNNINATDNYFKVQSVTGRLRDPDSSTSSFGFSTQGPKIVRNNIEQVLYTGAENVQRVPPRLPSYTVANLPTGMSAGAEAIATNGRREGEGAGAGTGCPVVFLTGAWRRSTDLTAVTA